MAFKVRHGHAKRRTGTYASWVTMRQRCRDVNAANYARYGGRGITVCERWDSFEAFLEDMGEKPDWATGGIDRIDNDGNYEPGNCRWATRSEQQRNKSVSTHCVRGHAMDEANTYVSPGGQRHCRACTDLRVAARSLPTHCSRGHLFDEENTLVTSNGKRRCKICIELVFTPRTHCARGHLMDDANTYVPPSGKRQCKACRALRAARVTS